MDLMPPISPSGKRVTPSTSTRQQLNVLFFRERGNGRIPIVAKKCRMDLHSTFVKLPKVSTKYVILSFAHQKFTILLRNRPRKAA